MPLFRAVMHLMMLATLLSLMITAMHYPELKEIERQIVKAVTENFGELKVSAQGLKPSINPEQKRKIEIIPGMILEYFPDADFTAKDLQADNYNQGLVWTPGVVAVWIKGLYVFPLIYSESALTGRTTVKMEPATPEGIAAFVKDFHRADSKFSFSNLSQMTDMGLWISMILSYFLQLIMIFFGGLLFTTLFTGFYALGGGTGLAGVRYKNIWLIGLYAGFPALIVGAVTSGLNLPYVDFSTIYLFGFLGYFFFIVSRMQRDQLNRLENMEKK